MKLAKGSVFIGFLPFLFGCSYSSYNVYIKGELKENFGSGIYQLSSCSIGNSIGYFIKENESGKSKTFSFCISDQYNYDAWAYLWVNRQGQANICFSMVGYAQEIGGISEVGRRVDDCHLLS